MKKSHSSIILSKNSIMATMYHIFFIILTSMAHEYNSNFYLFYRIYSMIVQGDEIHNKINVSVCPIPPRLSAVLVPLFQQSLFITIRV